MVITVWLSIILVPKQKQIDSSKVKTHPCYITKKAIRSSHRFADFLMGNSLCKVYNNKPANPTFFRWFYVFKYSFGWRFLTDFLKLWFACYHFFILFHFIFKFNNGFCFWFKESIYYLNTEEGSVLGQTFVRFTHNRRTLKSFVKW